MIHADYTYHKHDYKAIKNNYQQRSVVLSVISPQKVTVTKILSSAICDTPTKRTTNTMEPQDFNYIKTLLKPLKGYATDQNTL